MTAEQLKAVDAVAKCPDAFSRAWNEFGEEYPCGWQESLDWLEQSMEDLSKAVE